MLILRTLYQIFRDQPVISAILVLMEESVNKIANWLGAGSINFFGPPFSGKDTQAKMLADKLGGVVVAGGDILRHNHGNSEVQRIMAEGGIIPSELFLTIIPPYFNSPELSGKPLLLSSVGRLMNEVPTILQATSDSGHNLKAVILLKLPDEKVWEHFEIAQKLQDRGARADDTSEALKVRLEEYGRTTEVIEYYRAQNFLIEIDDTLTPEEVGQEIIAALSDKANSENS